MNRNNLMNILILLLFSLVSNTNLFGIESRNLCESEIICENQCYDKGKTLGYSAMGLTSALMPFVGKSKFGDIYKAGNKVDDVAGVGTQNTKIRNSTIIGKEAHRQLELEGLGKWDPEVTIKLPNGITVRKDGVGIMNPNEVRIIKPNTKSGIISANKRAKLMRKYGYKPIIDYYNPNDPRFQPGSPTYIGPRK